jgi:hypothetical protein
MVVTATIATTMMIMRSRLLAISTRGPERGARNLD